MMNLFGKQATNYLLDNGGFNMQYGNFHTVKCENGFCVVYSRNKYTHIKQCSKIYKYRANCIKKMEQLFNQASTKILKQKK